MKNASANSCTNQARSERTAPHIENRLLVAWNEACAGPSQPLLPLALGVHFLLDHVRHRGDTLPPTMLFWPIESQLHHARHTDSCTRICSGGDGWRRAPQT